MSCTIKNKMIAVYSDEGKGKYILLEDLKDMYQYLIDGCDSELKSFQDEIDLIDKKYKSKDGQLAPTFQKDSDFERSGYYNDFIKDVKLIKNTYVRLLDMIK